MKNITQAVGKLQILERMKNSASGNPRFRCFIFETPTHGISFVTMPDHASNYDIQNLDGQVVTVTVGMHRNQITLNSIVKGDKRL